LVKISHAKGAGPLRRFAGSIGRRTGQLPDAPDLTIGSADALLIKSTVRLMSGVK
jgi:hypothetical protein